MALSPAERLLHVTENWRSDSLAMITAKVWDLYPSLRQYQTAFPTSAWDRSQTTQEQIDHVYNAYYHAVRNARYTYTYWQPAAGFRQGGYWQRHTVQYGNTRLHIEQATAGWYMIDRYWWQKNIEPGEEKIKEYQALSEDAMQRAEQFRHDRERFQEETAELQQMTLDLELEAIRAEQRRLEHERDAAIAQEEYAQSAEQAAIARARSEFYQAQSAETQARIDEIVYLMEKNISDSSSESGEQFLKRRQFTQTAYEGTSELADPTKSATQATSGATGQQRHLLRKRAAAGTKPNPFTSPTDAAGQKAA